MIIWPMVRIFTIAAVVMTTADIGHKGPYALCHSVI